MDAGCLPLDIICDFTPKMDINKGRVLGVFVSQCLGSEDGFVRLCGVDFDVLEVRHGA
jgi:hypothetical protein